MAKDFLGPELVQFEDRFWYFKQYAKQLQEYRDEISIIWDDNAAGEINGRFLDPQRDDCDLFEESLGKQYEYLKEMTNHCLKLSADFELVKAMGREIDVFLQQCAEDISKSLNTMEVSKGKRGDCLLKLNNSIANLKKAREMK
ncbi:MAG: hypothetical protein ACFB2Y_00950 [Fulvivirga sp.]